MRYVPKRKPRRKFLRYLLLLAILLGAGWVVKDRLKDDSVTETTNQQSSKTATSENQAQQPARPTVNLQPVLDDWLAKNSGTYSVVVRDLDADKIVAAHNEDTAYFMASLYKLYVAYLAYLDIQNGKHNLDEPFLNTWTRGKCLDEMIRTSHSPCGEKYMAELDRAVIEDRLKPYDFTGTDYGAFVTTAHDSDLILARIHKRRDLNDKHTNLLLDAMKGNIYRDALVKGVPADATAYDKVGFRETVEYHDVAIVALSGNRNYAISILTKSAGSRRIADLTKQLIAAIP